MIGRLLLAIGAFLALLRWLRRRPRAPTASHARQAAPARSDTMVRDRVCNTYLPRAGAIVRRVGDEELFFCSERCLDLHNASDKSRN